MPYSMLRPAIGVWVTFVLAALAIAAPGQPGTTPQSLAPHQTLSPSVAAPAGPGPLILEELPQPLDPMEPPDQQQQDRLEALAMFSAGRMLEQQEKYQEALRLYQRAFRYDPKAVTILRAIVPLAYQLERHAEAVRYVLKLVALENADPLLLNQLGTYLTETGDWQAAIQLYERAVAARSSGKEGAPHIVLRMQMGRLYHLLGKHEKAAECFAVVMQALDNTSRYGIDDQMSKVILGDAAPTYKLMGEVFLLSKQLGSAGDAFRRVDKIKPNPALLSYHLGRVDLAGGKPEAALERLQPYLDAHLVDEGVEPYQLLSDALKALDRSQELLPKLEALRAVDGKNVPLAYFLADTYREAGQRDKAEPLYRWSMELAPDTAGYRGLAEIYRATKRPERLLDVLGQAIDKNASLEALGDEAGKISGDAETIQSLVEAARAGHQAAPEHSGFGPSLAIALVAQEAKKYDVSGEFFDRAIQTQPNRAAQLLLTWGLGLLLDEKYAEAIDVFRRGAEGKGKDEQKAVFNFYLAGALAMQDQTEAALAAARKAVELKPDVARFHGRIGWIYYHAKRLDDGAKAYREVVERFGSQYNSPDTRQSLREARLVLSNIGVTHKQISEAEKWLEQVLDEFPDDVAAMNDLGYLWADQKKNLQRAHRMIQAAVQAEPENAAYRDSLGWVLFRLGRLDEAIVELEKAAHEGSDPTVSDHLGDAYLAKGQPDKARQTWQKAVVGFKEQQENDTLQAVQQKIRDSQK